MQWFKKYNLIVDVGYWYHLYINNVFPFYEEVLLMTNEALTILLQCGLFFIAFLELRIGLIDKFTKK